MNELLKDIPELPPSGSPEAKPSGAVATPATKNDKGNVEVVELPDTTALTLSTVAGASKLARVAAHICNSKLVPKEYQGEPASVIIAIDMANRIGASPMQVMQNLYIVQGRPSWSAKFLISTFNSCGKFSPIRYEFVGEPNTDGYGCRAHAKEKATGQALHGPVITIGIAKKEGWYSKNGSKWQTIPDLMLMYRAAAWFINTIAPEIAMGLSTTDEAEDSADADTMDAPKPQPASRAAQVKASLIDGESK